MIKKKFLCYQTTQEFQKELDLIPDTSIVFVLDKGYIYTHGTYIFDPAIQEALTKALSDLEKRVDDNEKTLSDVRESLDQKVDNILDTVSTIADQIDESFQVWKSEENVTPTLKNEPASEWKTDTDKASHINDYYVNSEGFVWQFMFDGGAYRWVSVSDELLIKAAQLATEKVRNFITKPTDASKYDIGDIWVNATYPTDGSLYSNDTLVCIFGKEAGEPFQISDWQLSSKYTDDTRADEAFELATQTTSELNIEKGKLEAFTQKVTFDEDGDITNISKDGLVLTEDYAALFTAEKNKNGLATKSEVQTSVEGVKAVTDKISFDAAGNVTNISKNGLVLTEDYATLFAGQKDAEGLATKAEVQDGISKATIQADQVKIKTQYESGSATIDADTNVVVISGATAFINLNLPKMKDAYDGRMLTILNISSSGGSIIAGENEDSEYNNCINWVDKATYSKVNLNAGRHICRLIYCAEQEFVVNGTTCRGTWIAL